MQKKSGAVKSGFGRATFSKLETCNLNLANYHE